MNYRRHSYGFSLIEMMITIVIVGIISTVLSAALFGLLHGASKADIIKEIKQNGDYTVAVMEIKIRNSLDVSTCTGVASNQLTILNSDNTQSTFQCNSTSLAIEENISGTIRVLTNSAVAVPACDTANIAFTCTSSTTGAKAISIAFNLKEAGTNKTAAETSFQLFKTQVSLRNK